MSFPPYSQYQDTGIEWLGRVPAHWSTSRLKRSTTNCKNGVWGSEPDGNGSDIICVRVADFDRTKFRVALGDPTFRSVPHRDRAGRVLNPGDLLIEKSGGGEGQPVGVVVRYDDSREAVCSNFVARMELADGMDSTYWCYLHAAAYSVRLNVRSIKQTSGIQNLDQSSYLDEMAPYPPPSEQQAIAAFLDRETGKIDALVDEQKRLIELLKEKRLAVISHAVTKGLNPDVPMKDSGVEWLGEVPEHWTRVQLGRLCRQVSDGPHFSPKYVEDGVMFLSARNIKVDGWSLGDAKFITEEDYAEFCRRVTPERGDVLYTKGGTTGIAKVVDLDERFQVWVHVAVLKIDTNLADSDYVAFALNSHGCYEQSQLYTQGATNQDLGLTRMVKIWMALPPCSEQREIVSHLQRRTTEFDKLIDKAEQSVNLLHERRTALISAAVTGKIDLSDFTESGSNAPPISNEAAA